jgi:uncharacterized membrane protein
MKNKFYSSWAHGFFRKQQKIGAKKAFGLASIALILLSVLPLTFLGFPAIILFLPGILAGLISLFIKKDSSEKNTGKSLGLIGLLLGAVILTAFIIAFSNWHD